MTIFRYDPAVIEAHPTVVGGVVHATGVHNGLASAELREAFTREQATVRARIGETPLSELPTLSAWRRAFRAFGVDPTHYRSAAEALLRRLVKQGELPSISTLVDLANLVSIRHALPVAVFDRGLDRTGPPTLGSTERRSSRRTRARCPRYRSERAKGLRLEVVSVARRAASLGAWVPVAPEGPRQEDHR